MSHAMPHYVLCIGECSNLTLPNCQQLPSRTIVSDNATLQIKGYCNKPCHGPHLQLPNYNISRNSRDGRRLGESEGYFAKSTLANSTMTVKVVEVDLGIEVYRFRETDTREGVPLNTQE